eukprot:TRINITY_DN9478_c0_g1_i1.p1 TRINITY_DN9478_c0_g1~~TRINITY_DN9478_c0_g1_i1.p1  ORF type:complete len:755 (+),score=76.24 TRINITY_DN9478_c0_g1_i1:924-3188(+)
MCFVRIAKELFRRPCAETQQALYDLAGRCVKEKTLHTYEYSELLTVFARGAVAHQGFIESSAEALDAVEQGREGMTACTLVDVVWAYESLSAHKESLRSLQLIAKSKGDHEGYISLEKVVRLLKRTVKMAEYEIPSKKAVRQLSQRVAARPYLYEPSEHCAWLNMMVVAGEHDMAESLAKHYDRSGLAILFTPSEAVAALTHLVDCGSTHNLKHLVQQAATGTLNQAVFAIRVMMQNYEPSLQTTLEELLDEMYNRAEGSVCKVALIHLCGEFLDKSLCVQRVEKLLSLIKPSELSLVALLGYIRVVRGRNEFAMREALALNPQLMPPAHGIRFVEELVNGIEKGFVTVARVREVIKRLTSRPLCASPNDIASLLWSAAKTDTTVPTDVLSLFAKLKMRPSTLLCTNVLWYISKSMQRNTEIENTCLEYLSSRDPKRFPFHIQRRLLSSFLKFKKYPQPLSSLLLGSIAKETSASSYRLLLSVYCKHPDLTSATTKDMLLARQPCMVRDMTSESLVSLFQVAVRERLNEELEIQILEAMGSKLKTSHFNIDQCCKVFSVLERANGLGGTEGLKWTSKITSAVGDRVWQERDKISGRQAADLLISIARVQMPKFMLSHMTLAVQASVEKGDLSPYRVAQVCSSLASLRAGHTIAASMGLSCARQFTPQEATSVLLSCATLQTASPALWKELGTKLEPFIPTLPAVAVRDLIMALAASRLEHRPFIDIIQARIRAFEPLASLPQSQFSVLSEFLKQ